MSEHLPSHQVERAHHDPDQQVALAHMAIAGFHGADTHMFGRYEDGSIGSIITKQHEEGGSSNERVGQGEDTLKALADTLEGMRSLETASVKPIVRLQMGGDRTVTLASVEHFAPKTTPGAEAYPVPDYLKRHTEDVHNVFTYKNTTDEADWEDQLVDVAERYVATERGTELMTELGIKSLHALTPEQAVKFSVEMVLDTSKYTKDAKGQPNGGRADGSTTMQLLSEGLERKDDDTWQGNGVCRNVAWNAKAVFNALKARQGELSMLNNTYITFVPGFNGKGFADIRGGTATEASHAWVRAMNVDAKGSASISEFDPTFALETDGKSAREHLDQTLPRSAALVNELFMASDDKLVAFDEVGFYYSQLMTLGIKERADYGAEQMDARTQFAVTKYLEAAAIAVPLYEQDGQQVPEAPSALMVAARRIGTNLTMTELTTMSQLSEAQALRPGSFRGVLAKYLMQDFTNDPTKIAQLAYCPNAMQADIMGVLDRQKIAAYAERNQIFEAQVRKHRPDLMQ